MHDLILAKIVCMYVHCFYWFCLFIVSFPLIQSNFLLSLTAFVSFFISAHTILLPYNVVQCSILTYCDHRFICFRSFITILLRAAFDSLFLLTNNNCFLPAAFAGPTHTLQFFSFTGWIASVGTFISTHTTILFF